MANFMGDYAALYWREDPTSPGRPVPDHVTPFRINDDVSTEAEVESAVLHLRLNKVGGHTHLRAEKFKKCMREAYLAEGTSSPTPNSERYINLVDLTQYIW